MASMIRAKVWACSRHDVTVLVTQNVVNARELMLGRRRDCSGLCWMGLEGMRWMFGTV